MTDRQSLWLVIGLIALAGVVMLLMAGCAPPTPPDQYNPEISYFAAGYYFADPVVERLRIIYGDEFVEQILAYGFYIEGIYGMPEDALKRVLDFPTEEFE